MLHVYLNSSCWISMHWFGHIAFPTNWGKFLVTKGRNVVVDVWRDRSPTRADFLARQIGPEAVIISTLSGISEEPVYPLWTPLFWPTHKFTTSNGLFLLYLLLPESQDFVLWKWALKNERNSFIIFLINPFSLPTCLFSLWQHHCLSNGFISHYSFFHASIFQRDLCATLILLKLYPFSCS